MAGKANRRSRGYLGACVIAGLGMASTGVLAQTAPSRVAPESISPAPPPAEGPIVLPETAAGEAPPASDRLSVRIASVEVTGGSPAFASVIARAAAAVVNRQVRVSELYAAAAQIEEAYARAGYVLTRVTVPPQNVTNGGVFRLLIVDGFIEDVDVDRLPQPVRAAVRRRVAALIGVPGLTLAQIERRVLLAGDTPGLNLRSTLVRGAGVGAARLVLDGRYEPLSASVSADNSLGSAYHYGSFSGQISLNSVLGGGEQVYVQATSGPDFGHLFAASTVRRILGTGAIVPLGDDGLTFNPEYIRVDTNPSASAGATQITGLFTRLDLRASYPLIRTRKETLDLTGAFEISSESEVAKAFAQTLNLDRLRVVSLGLDWARTLSARDSLSSDIQYAQGIAGLGARRAADVLASGIPFSRQGSAPDFSKLTGHVRFDDQLGDGLALTSIIKGQASFTGALPASAQFSLDGGDSLSSFALGSLSVDSGVTARSELSLSKGFRSATASGLISPYVFGAVGYGRLSDPTALERSSLESWVVGSGVRLLLSHGETGISSFGSIEVSHGHASNFAKDASRVSASLTFRY
jgi:hemolysin activation/secretion protein